MKKLSLLVGILCIVLSSFAKAPWDVKLPTKTAKKSMEIFFPTVDVVTGTWQAGSPNHLIIRVILSGITDEHWGKAVVRFYCRYWHQSFPSGYWGWGYKNWQAEVAPYSPWGDTDWGLTTETFHTYDAGDGVTAIDDNDVTLISWQQE